MAVCHGRVVKFSPQPSPLRHGRRAASTRGTEAVPPPAPTAGGSPRPVWARMLSGVGGGGREGSSPCPPECRLGQECPPARGLGLGLHRTLWRPARRLQVEGPQPPQPHSPARAPHAFPRGSPAALSLGRAGSHRAGAGWTQSRTAGGSPAPATRHGGAQPARTVLRPCLVGGTAPRTSDVTDSRPPGKPKANCVAVIITGKGKSYESTHDTE